MCNQSHLARVQTARRFTSRRSIAIALLALLLSACGTAATPAPIVPPPSGTERISNGGFEGGQAGWIASPAEAEGVEVLQPIVDATAAHAGANGVRFATQPTTQAISAFEQEFPEAKSYTFTFWVRPQAGASRIGLAADGRRSNVNVSRLVFLNAGEDSSQIVWTAWDVNYVFAYPLLANVWLPVRVAVDSAKGVQTLSIGNNHTVTISAVQPDRPAAKAVVFGDRQPRIDAYTIPNTNARVTDGLNGTYDYDEISLIGP
jgi:hypothetical protein